MKKPNTPTPSPEAAAEEQVFKEAVKAVVAEHHAAGQSVPVLEDGKVEWRQPPELEAAEAADRIALAAAKADAHRRRQVQLLNEIIKMDEAIFAKLANEWEDYDDE